MNPATIKTFIVTYISISGHQKTHPIKVSNASFVEEVFQMAVRDYKSIVSIVEKEETKEVEKTN
jgi:hypothetical protein